VSIIGVRVNVRAESRRFDGVNVKNRSGRR
jgi:hypothetical protein